MTPSSVPPTLARPTGGFSQSRWSGASFLEANVAEQSAISWTDATYSPLLSRIDIGDARPDWVSPAERAVGIAGR